VRFFQEEVSCDDGNDKQGRANDIWENEREFSKETGGGEKTGVRLSWLGEAATN
jgi:hypothetical protein